MNLLSGLFGLFVTGSSASGVHHIRSRGLASMSASVNNRVSLGAGCYWGTEKFIKKDFGQEIVPGSVEWGKVGFMNLM